MDILEFRLMLDALGPEMASWPQDAANEAIDLLANSEAAQDLFAVVVASTRSVTDSTATGLADRVGRVISGEHKA